MPSYIKFICIVNEIISISENGGKRATVMERWVTCLIQSLLQPRMSIKYRQNPPIGSRKNVAARKENLDTFDWRKDSDESYNYLKRIYIFYQVRVYLRRSYIRKRIKNSFNIKTPCTKFIRTDSKRICYSSVYSLFGIYFWNLPICTSI